MQVVVLVAAQVVVIAVDFDNNCLFVLLAALSPSHLLALMYRGLVRKKAMLPKPRLQRRSL